MANISKSFYRDYKAAQKARNMNGTRFAVKSINKDGSISKMAVNPSIDVFSTKEQANAEMERRAKLNPGRSFMIATY